MKRNFFLLFISILLLLVLKESKSRVTTLVPLYIEKSQSVDFTGTLFIPKTLSINDGLVKKNKLRVISLSVAGKNYRYIRKYESNTFWIERDLDVKEVSIKIGDKITSSAPVKLFTLKDL